MPGDFSISAVEEALACVKRTLDSLTARGDNEAAFELARAQYATSIRSSWPGNLGSLVGTLKKIMANEALKLSEIERSELERAIQTFSEVRHP